MTRHPALAVVKPPPRQGSPEEEARQLLRDTGTLLRNLQQRVLREGSTGLAQSDAILGEAQDNLTRVIFMLRRNPGMREEGIAALAANLHYELKQVDLMMQQAVQFYAEWTRVVNLNSASYTGAGLAEASATAARFSVES